MAAKRGNPTVKVGNYAAQIDTTGMDPDDKAFFSDKIQPKKQPGLMDIVKNALKPKPKPKPKPKAY